MSDDEIEVMKPLRLTNRAITSAFDPRALLIRVERTGVRIDETMASYASELAKPYLAPIQARLDKVNGRAKARTISTAKEVLNCAIGVEVELRSKGVTVKNMKGTTIFLRGHAGFKNVSTGVYLEYRATGWYVTRIEKTYHDQGGRFVSITPAARADITSYQLQGYGESLATGSR